MTYEDLLKESYEEDFTADVPENDTFAAIESYMTENFSFLFTESSDFEVSFGIEDLVFEAAEDEEGNKKESIGIKAKEVGGKILEAAKKLIEKIGKWLSKIGEAIKRVVVKATTVLAKAGTNSKLGQLNKLIEKNPDAKLGADITLKKVKANNLTNIKTSLENTVSAINKINIPASHGNIEDIDARITEYKETLGAFKENIANSTAIFEDKEFKKGEKISKVYAESNLKKAAEDAAELIKVVNTESKKACTKCKDIQNNIKKNIENKSLSAQYYSGIGSIASVVMQGQTLLLKSTIEVLGIVAATSSKIMIAAVDAEGKKFFKSIVKKDEKKEEAAE